MAGRKKQESQIKEINTEDDWTNLCQIQGGITVIDIYSEWSGPCTAMTGHLKKIKLEVGDDSLHFAMAKSDAISALRMFRGHCKPTWLFMASGEPVAVMHGANAPLMRSMVEEQVCIEKSVQAGERSRHVISMEEAVPGDLKLNGIPSKAADKEEEKERTEQNLVKEEPSKKAEVETLKREQTQESPEKAKNAAEMDQVEEKQNEETVLLIEKSLLQDEEFSEHTLSTLQELGFTVARHDDQELDEESLAGLPQDVQEQCAELTLAVWVLSCPRQCEQQEGSSSAASLRQQLAVEEPKRLQWLDAQTSRLVINVLTGQTEAHVEHVEAQNPVL